MTNDVAHLVTYLFTSSIFASVRCLSRILAHSNWVVCHLIVDTWKFSVYRRYKSFIRYVIYKYFLPVYDIFIFLTVFVTKFLVFVMSILWCDIYKRITKPKLT